MPAHGKGVWQVWFPPSSSFLKLLLCVPERRDIQMRSLSHCFREGAFEKAVSSSRKKCQAAGHTACK